LLSLLVGAGLATAGVILQGISRNPLASPGVLGLNAGAAVGAVILLVWLPHVAVSWLPFAAFLGAFLAVSVTYVLSWKQGLVASRMILIGIGIAAVCHAFITLALIQGNIRSVAQASIWMTGSLYGRSWEHLAPVFPWIAIFLPLTFLLSRTLDVIGLGDDTARGLGSRVEGARFLLIIAAVALAGASVAAAGTIAFVGLMAPHIARRITGPMHRSLLPMAAIIGAFIVSSADLIGRLLFAPMEIPCGLLTAVIGVPFLLHLLYKHRTS
jgi:iron complex transport system permease protein